MTAFRLPVVPATLTIGDGPYAGLTVEVDSSVPALVRDWLVSFVTPREGESEADQVTRGRELFALLESRIILGWNLEDHRGKPIPPTADGFALVPPDLIATVIAHYLGG